MEPGISYTNTIKQEPTEINYGTVESWENNDLGPATKRRRMLDTSTATKDTTIAVAAAKHTAVVSEATVNARSASCCGAGGVTSAAASDTVSSINNSHYGHSEDLFQYDESDSEDGTTSAPIASGTTLVQPLKWSGELSTHAARPFNLQVGANSVAFNTAKTPTDFFHKFFLKEIYKSAQLETNNYAEFYQEKKRDLGREWWEWSDVSWEPVDSSEEIQVFVGICIAMAVHSMPDPRDYWSTQANVGNALIANSSMSMDRFDSIMRYLYLSNPWRDPEKIANLERRAKACNSDPFYKVNNNLHDFVKESCVAMYNSHQDVVMRDLVGTNLQLKTNGWKMLVLKDATTGYISNFQLYREKANSDQTLNQRHAVDSLLNQIKNMGHCVYVDRLFISTATASQFANTFHTDIVSDCSDWPEDITCNAANFAIGQTNSVQHKKITATVWKGKRVKRCLSTIHDGLMQPVSEKCCNSATRESTIETVLCPTAIFRHSAALDRLPRRLLLSQGSTLLKLTSSWWKRIVWLLVDICLNNAYVVWSEIKPRHLSYSEFAMEVATAMIHDSTQDGMSRLGGEEGGNLDSSIQEPQGSLLSQQDVAYPMEPNYLGYNDMADHQSDILHETGVITEEVSTQDMSSIINISEADDAPEGHQLVKFPGRGRNCKQCTADDTRTRSGRRRDTQYGCGVCRLNLCRSGCFVRYHELNGIKINSISLYQSINLAISPLPKRKKIPL